MLPQRFHVAIVSDGKIRHLISTTTLSCRNSLNASKPFFVDHHVSPQPSPTKTVVFRSASKWEPSCVETRPNRHAFVSETLSSGCRFVVNVFRTDDDPSTAYAKAFFCLLLLNNRLFLFLVLSTGGKRRRPSVRLRDLQTRVPRPHHDQLRPLLLRAVCPGALQNKSSLRGVRETGAMRGTIEYFS